MGYDSRLKLPLNQAADPARLANIGFSSDARSHKVVDQILPMPTSLITADISAAPVLVQTGNILRIRVTATTYIMFGPSTMTAPTSSTQGAIELFSAGVYLVVANNDFVMASANPARVEVLDGLK